MPGLSEIIRALTASVRLVGGDARGHRLFDHSFEGFLRSFSAIVLIAPIYVLTTRAELVMAATLGREVSEADVDFYFLRLLVLAVEWFAYPIAMIPLARMLMLGQRYVPYIVAYNWTSVLIAIAFLPPSLLFTLGIIPAGFAQFLFLLAVVWAFYFRYSIARTALETGAPIAVGLVVFDFLLGILINFVAVRLGL